MLHSKNHGRRHYERNLLLIICTLLMITLFIIYKKELFQLWMRYNLPKEHIVAPVHTPPSVTIMPR